MTDTAQITAPAAGGDALDEGAAPALPDCSASTSFPELVLAHHDWRRAVARGLPTVAALEVAYCARLAAFERAHGQIVNAYWCLNVPSGVALTEKSRSRPIAWFTRPRLGFHRATDWATQNRPKIAASLHSCDSLAIRAGHVLTGLRQRVCLQLVMASAAHLLSLADEKARHEDPKEVLVHEEAALAEARRYYESAANGQAQMVYFGGMAAFTLLLAGLAIPSGFFDPLPNIADAEFFGTLLAGAIGATVSVVQRINSRQFHLEYDVGRIYPFFVGGLRPLMGGIFGLVFYFAVSSGLLDLVPIAPEGTARFFALLVIAFLAGFSERWAKDTLAGAAAGMRPAEQVTMEVRDATVTSITDGATHAVAAPVPRRPFA